jgi:hypothetical protein
LHKKEIYHFSNTAFGTVKRESYVLSDNKKTHHSNIAYLLFDWPGKALPLVNFKNAVEKGVDFCNSLMLSQYSTCSNKERVSWLSACLAGCWPPLYGS